jgi:F1F0 ATPase subunit 2
MTAAVILACFAAGACLGALYFLGLGITVARLGQARRPLALLALSGLARVALLLAALALLTELEPGRLVACLLGFAGARLAATAMARPAAGAAGREPAA